MHVLRQGVASCGTAARDADFISPVNLLAGDFLARSHRTRFEKISVHEGTRENETRGYVTELSKLDCHRGAGVRMVGTLR